MSSDKEKIDKNINGDQDIQDSSKTLFFNNKNNDSSSSSTSTANNLTLKTLSISSINDSSSNNSDLNIENFDFSKTGAKPKSKSSQPSSSNKQKSSKSSVTSSSIKTDQMDIDDENIFINTINDVEDANRKIGSKNDEMIDQLQMLDDFTEIAECPLCGKIVKKNLQKHFELEHKEYECPFCGLLYDCEPILKEHIDSVHQCDEVVNLPNDSEFEVGDFDYKSNKNENESASKKYKIDNDDDVIVCYENDNNSFVCPICNLRIQDQTWLELHVESHFNSNNFQDDCLIDPFHKNDEFSGACSLQRTCSNSSLTANVDENFEIDQVMTLAECDLTNSTNNSVKSDNVADKSNVSDKENPCSSVSELNDARDYQLAQMLERQDRENLKYKKIMEQQNVSPFKFNDHQDSEQTSKDYLTAQLIERQELESLKYNEWPKTDENSSQSTKQYQQKSKYRRKYDENMTPAEELEWLKNQYGMTDQDSFSKAKINLDRALKTKKIDKKTYDDELTTLKTDLESIYDNSKTRSTGLIGVLNNMNYSKWLNRRYLCTLCDHYGTGILDSGYGCGYRNTQMLLSSIRADPKLCDKLFNNKNLNMPSVAKLQSLIEKAWELGFDVIGKDQFNGSLVNTVKWIGASDIAALFSSLRIKVELVDIYEPKTPNESIANVLFNFVKDYFENSKGHVHPIYLQHQGHSRTIVGIEIGKNSSMNLILYDPGTRTQQIENFKSDQFKFMYIFRKGAQSFKHKQYQLLVIRGLIETDYEYENAKVLKSSRLQY